MNVDVVMNKKPPIHKKMKDVKIGEAFTTGGALYVRVNPIVIDNNINKIILFNLNNNYLYEGVGDKEVTMMETKIITT